MLVCRSQLWFATWLALLCGCGRIGYLQQGLQDAGPGDGATDSGLDGGLPDTGVDGGTICDAERDIGVSPAVCPPGPPCPLLVSDISSSDKHTCAVDQGGDVYCWGRNCAGELGLGDQLTRLAPVQVTLPEPIADIEVGDGFSCARSAAGAVYCWGSNERGATGTNNQEDQLSPAGPILGSPSLARLELGSRHGCSVDTSGTLRCWGDNREGQLGLFDPFPEQGISRFAPEVVGAASWSQLALGGGHSCGVQTDGTLHCTGRNVAGQLGIGIAAGGQLREFQAVGSDTDWAVVEAGTFNNCALKTDMRMFCWGDGTGGALGMGDAPAIETPTLHSATPWRTVSLSAFHGCGVDAMGDLTCWGRAIEGQLGVPQLDPELFPILSPSDPGNVVQVETGRFSTYVVTGDGRVFVTGANNLGHGLQTRLSTFTQLFLP